MMNLHVFPITEIIPEGAFLITKQNMRESPKR